MNRIDVAAAAVQVQGRGGRVRLDAAPERGRVVSALLEERPDAGGVARKGDDSGERAGGRLEAEHVGAVLAGGAAKQARMAPRGTRGP